MCLGGIHKTVTVNTFYTNMTERGRPTCFQPCPNLFSVKEKPCGVQISYHNVPQLSDRSSCESDHLGCCVFEQTKSDNQVSPSIQDNAFMKIMEEVGMSEYTTVCICICTRSGWGLNRKWVWFGWKWVWLKSVHYFKSEIDMD